MFSPVEASESIVKKYKRYLQTIFDIQDPDYKYKFRQEIAGETTYADGPYLDVSDTFVKGESISSLIQNGTLKKGMAKVSFPMDRPLYRHQELAAEKALSGRNMVVSTGTGSGKTESFLIPVLNHIVSEWEAGTLTPGVRALIIYPMNALANDQIERLRGLLENFPQITYGSYTGQTKERTGQAISEFMSLNEGRRPSENELVSREQMKTTPPNILITNYAMLEYLMVRPDDSVFFDGDRAGSWKFIVLDEAHIYRGSTGIEVSMLLRRLKAKLRVPKLQYILTSATLGDERENEQVAQFASDLCDGPFEAVDVIRALRREPVVPKDTLALGSGFYQRAAELLEDEAGLLKILKEYASLYRPDAQTPAQMLYDILLHDQCYWKARSLVRAPLPVREFAKAMGLSRAQAEQFVAVASACERNRDRLFDARYHMFLRAADSVFITLGSSRKLFLTRKPMHQEADGSEYCVFEIAACSACHAIYLTGKDEDGYLRQTSLASGGGSAMYLLGSDISDTDDDHHLEEENITTTKYMVCARCGHLRKADSVNGEYCEHGPAEYVRVVKVKSENEEGRLTKCATCESINPYGIVRMFFAGQEAVTSVIGTALYEALPSYHVVRETHHASVDSGFDFDPPEETVERQRAAKQFLTFSDSRQAAAYFASYFDQTYHAILYKRLIVESLRTAPLSGAGSPLTDFVENLTYQFEQGDIPSPRKEAWKALLAEAVDNASGTSLNSLGLLSFALDPRDIPGNTRWNLSKEQVGDIVNVMALGMMADAAIQYNEPLTEADRSFFTHNGVECSYVLSDSDKKGYRRSFIPTSAGRSNKRLDYLSRVAAKNNPEKGPEEVLALLEGIWRSILAGRNYVIQKDGVYKLDAGRILITKPAAWYVCDKCGALTLYNVCGICPSYRCDGTLHPADPQELFEGNHYYALYREMDIRDLRIKEHTAQLDHETAYEYQKQFIRKQIDVLSCSTTFELGVDVGTLETVFMRNVPPSPANYAQRAGRAGRSLNAAAYALTFCNKSSHDFTYFKAPVQMIRGQIHPPRFHVSNDRIAIRHVHAATLGFFWKQYPQYFKNATSMMDAPDGASGYECLKQYLLGKPEDLKQYLKAFLPPALANRFDIENFGWVKGLIGEGEQEPGSLARAMDEYRSDVDALVEARNEAIREDKNKLIYVLGERIKVYQNENILTFLSRKNVMPKYGFPVDTVEMTINLTDGAGRLGLQLQRDLSMAISEYAPGSQIVANGSLITSRYIRKNPRMGWKMSDYAFCPQCNTLNVEQHISLEHRKEMSHTCRACGHVFRPTPRSGTFLIPEFGFEADGDKIEKPGLIRPERTYRGEIAYIGTPHEQEKLPCRIAKAEFELWLSHDDELAVLNQSNFFVCPTCGYTDLDDHDFLPFKKMKHTNSRGYPCRNGEDSTLARYALGYRFKTDVLQIRFEQPHLVDFKIALSVLHSVLRGLSSYLDIEQSDVSGCLQYYMSAGAGSYALVLYDKTPGGSGYVRQMNDPRVIEGVLRKALALMRQCDCGGETGDASCYSCLRDYYNQKYHDVLNRGDAIEFLSAIFG